MQDFSAENGVLSDLSVAEDRLSATLTLTPDATIEDTANVVSLTGANFTDAAGNLGTGTGTSNSYAVDTVSPTMNSAVVSSNGLSIVITYSELVGGTLEPADYAVTIDGQAYSGTIDAAVIGTDSDANKVTLTLSSPIQSGSVVTNLIYTANAGAVNSVTDVVGNPAASQTLSSVSNGSSADTIAPTVTSITVADSSLIIGETTTVTVVFSEAIAPESLVLQDFSAENGVLSDLSVAEDRLSATLTLTPDATIEDTANVVSLTGANFTDAAGNLGTGTGTSNSYAVDTVSPTMNSAVVSSNGLSIVITYSELVGGTLEPADYAVTIDGQAYSGTIDAAVIGTDSDANKVTLTLSSPIQSGSVVTNLIYTANAGAVNSVTDVVGNPAASQTLSSVSNGSSADTIAPTVTSITVADSSLIIGETTTVTVVFRRRLLLNRWYCKIFLLRMVC
ncbi:MAG: Ig-like domain-containing protein [Methylophilaceae bacterium]|nr:MAG: Ig-like domain-containing protein [Methylophilaceae bacterium]